MSENIEREIKIFSHTGAVQDRRKAFSVGQNNRADQFLLYSTAGYGHDKYPCQADRRKIFFAA